MVYDRELMAIDADFMYEAEGDLLHSGPKPCEAGSSVEERTL
jgi:hypothetical protein